MRKKKIELKVELLMREFCSTYWLSLTWQVTELSRPGENVKINRSRNRLTPECDQRSKTTISGNRNRAMNPRPEAKLRVRALHEGLLSRQVLCNNFHEGYLHISSPDRIMAFLEARIIVSFTFSSPATSSTHSFNIRQINLSMMPSWENQCLSWHSSKASAWVKVKIFIIRQVCFFLYFSFHFIKTMCAHGFNHQITPGLFSNKAN